MTSLFDPLSIGSLQLPNRVIMAPLTRMRSRTPGNIPWELNATYYAQRASAGLIVSEATQVSQQGQGYPGTPGIHTAEQRDGWKLVTNAVHEQNGRIALQLWHVGRISHRSHQPDHQLPVAPSPIKPAGGTFSATWEEVPFETPRALETQEIKGIIQDFVHGARLAKEAGFDMVEVHGANGYLLDQFLQNGSNTRTDAYGGSLENRARLLMEVIDAVSSVYESSHVGVRLSPYGTFNDMSDSDPVALFSYVLKTLSTKSLGYVHLIEPRSSASGMEDATINSAPHAASLFRKAYDGILISAGGHTPESAQKEVKDGLADAVAFGRLFISNPDLPRRLQQGADLNRYDRSTFYGGKEVGYTDYPSLSF
jgi:N-ethylmaleimide reductase